MNRPGKVGVVACDGLKSVAVREPERARGRSSRPFDARHRPRPRHAHRVAAGRVEREARDVDSHVDGLDVTRQPIDDRRDESEAVGHPWATRKRSKRGNSQAGQQLMRRPTRKRSKRGNRQAGESLTTGHTRKRSKRGNGRADCPSGASL